MARPWLWVTTRGDRALVCGRDAERTVKLLVDNPQYSRSGRGWVIPVGAVEDLWCYAWTRREFIGIRKT